MIGQGIADVVWLLLQTDVDILVNAVGIAPTALYALTKPEMIAEVVRTNILGAMWGCRIMSNVMAMHRKTDPSPHTGCIINVASLLGVKRGTDAVAYAASKSAVLALTRSLATELAASRIRVNTIVPGYVETQMVEGEARRYEAFLLSIVTTSPLTSPTPHSLMRQVRNGNANST